MGSLGHPTPQDQRVKLRYIQWDPVFTTTKPFAHLSATPAGHPQQNFTVAEEPEEIIHDIRGREDEFTLDEHSFKVARHELRIETFDKETVEGKYYGEIERLIKSEVEDVAEVIFFDWRLRSSNTDRTTQKADSSIPATERYLPPAPAVHIDQTGPSARKRVKHHLPGRADDLLSRRYRIINVWRPLRNPIEDCPLALCDGSTSITEKILAADQLREGYNGEALYPLYAQGYKWQYLNRQTKDEVLMFKTYDSKPDVKARCCPHTSFRMSGVADTVSPRESIEVRAMVFSHKT